MSPIYEIDVHGADERAESALRDAGLLGHGIPTNPIGIGNAPIQRVVRARVEKHSAEAAMDRIKGVLDPDTYETLGEIEEATA